MSFQHYNDFRVNYKAPEIYEYKFGKKPKVWTISQLHDLYLRLRERSSKRTKELIKYGDYVIKTIKENKKKERIIYFTDKGKIYMYCFTQYYHGMIMQYGITTRELSLSNREKVLDYLLDGNEEAFEIGQEYYRLNMLTTRLHGKIRNFISQEITRKLQAHFTKTGTTPCDTFVINLEGVKYFVKTIDKHNSYNGYFRFEISNEYCQENEININ
jgi:hypothetical protein